MGPKRQNIDIKIYRDTFSKQIRYDLRNGARQTHNGQTTSLQRRCNVLTLQRRCCDIVCLLGKYMDQREHSYSQVIITKTSPFKYTDNFTTKK